MQLREALIQQSPSLALQRAAADEIARLDAEVEMLTKALDSLIEAVNYSKRNGIETAAKND